MMILERERIGAITPQGELLGIAKLPQEGRATTSIAEPPPPPAEPAPPEPPTPPIPGEDEPVPSPSVQ